ncbi:hypothetical protein P9112_005519 [Eukaryota sp. TZLM1-RC]
MSDIVSDSEIILTLPISLTVCRDEKKDNEVTDPVPTSFFNLFFTEQQSTSPRTPQSATVILLNKKTNGRSEPRFPIESALLSVIL